MRGSTVNKLNYTGIELMFCSILTSLERICFFFFLVCLFVCLFVFLFIAFCVFSLSETQI